MSLDDLQKLLGPGGLGVAGVFAVMWWLERKERLRLQTLLEQYLMPMVEDASRAFRGMRRIVQGNGGDE